MSELTRRIIRVDVDPDGRCSFFYSDMHDDPFESNEYLVGSQTRKLMEQIESDISDIIELNDHWKHCEEVHDSTRII